MSIKWIRNLAQVVWSKADSDLALSVKGLTQIENNLLFYLLLALPIFAGTKYLAKHVEFQTVRDLPHCYTQESMKNTSDILPSRMTLRYQPNSTCPSCSIPSSVTLVGLVLAVPPLQTALLPLLFQFRSFLYLYAPFLSPPRLEVLAASASSQHMVSTWSTSILPSL